MFGQEQQASSSGMAVHWSTTTTTKVTLAESLLQLMMENGSAISHQVAPRRRAAGSRSPTGDVQCTSHHNTRSAECNLLVPMVTESNMFLTQLWKVVGRDAGRYMDVSNLLQLQLQLHGG